jgi:REG-2-like HAD superfamily hydrolase
MPGNIYEHAIAGPFKQCHVHAQLLCRHYARPEAWTVTPGVVDAVQRIRAAGVKVCVLSNFDNRLRPLLTALGIAELFDNIIVSSEVGAEKPSPKIFYAACGALGVDPTRDFVLHVGDDRRNDVWGARACGIDAWLWGEDVACFEEVADRIVTGYTTL